MTKIEFRYSNYAPLTRYFHRVPLRKKLHANHCIKRLKLVSITINTCHNVEPTSKCRVAHKYPKQFECIRTGKKPAKQVVSAPQRIENSINCIFHVNCFYFCAVLRWWNKSAGVLNGFNLLTLLTTNISSHIHFRIATIRTICGDDRQVGANVQRYLEWRS